jgi:hypothetical protein
LRFSCVVLSARWDTVMASSGCLNISSRIWSNTWPLYSFGVFPSFFALSCCSYVEYGIFVCLWWFYLRRINNCSNIWLITQPLWKWSLSNYSLCSIFVTDYHFLWINEVPRIRTIKLWFCPTLEIKLGFICHFMFIKGGSVFSPFFPTITWIHLFKQKKQKTLFYSLRVFFWLLTFLKHCEMIHLGMVSGGFV